MQRSPDPGRSVTIVGVSKLMPASAVAAAAVAGLTHFGENYLQEGIEKIAAVDNPALTWHFIGRIQSNKTRLIAESFAWVETIDRIRIAERLNAQRPDALGPLNVLIQLNVDREPQKGGARPDDLMPLAEAVSKLPRLKLRGIMGMPPADSSPERNRRSFLAIAAATETLRNRGFGVDTVSMGMSADFELAIECGSNLVRLGTALFGPRPAG
ncbi:MAG TPA: YggS family pyridoxal phosphate-dependent enzyme [Gammaproteobacteria bacterium]|nr:YggS family pyridoxal phosphate-dependent enzyme [Gammaproteobacteria bacterium]